MLPGQIDLVLQITTALRTRSARAQGDDQAIRGLLQILGELFRSQRLADQPVGRLVTLDQIYEVQHTALDADVQASMARVLSQCTADTDALLVRAAKAVALLELIQETQATDARLVAQCLYDRVDRGNQVAAVTEALEELRRRNLLGYSEKLGYKLQSSAGEEWERERRDIPAPREALGEIVQEGLKYLLGTPDRPQLQGRSFPWAARFSDGRRADDVSLQDPRDNAAVLVDFRYLAPEERTESTWVRRSGEAALHDRLVWLSGDSDGRRRVRTRAAPLARHGQEVQVAPRLAQSRPQAPAPAGGEPRRGPRQARTGHHRGGVAGRTDVLPGPRHLASRPWRDVRRRAPPGGYPGAPRPVPALHRDAGPAVRAAPARRGRPLRPVAQVPHRRPWHHRGRRRTVRPLVQRRRGAPHPGVHRVGGRQQRDGAPRPVRRPALRLHAERREGLCRGPAARQQGAPAARGRR